MKDDVRPTHMQNLTVTHITYRIAGIRAEDLRDTDTAMIGGRCREIAAAHTAEDDGWTAARDFSLMTFPEP